MAKQRIFDLVSILSAALSSEDDLIAHHFLVTSIDMPDNTMSDPGLKKEILPGWWDTEGFKLPQTYIKSVPQESAVIFLFFSSFKLIQDFCLKYLVC